MRCRGVPTGGKRVSPFDAFTIHVPYGAVYYTDNSSDGGQEFYIKLLDEIPGNYKEGLFYLPDNADGTKLHFTLMQAFSEDDEVTFSKVIKNRDILFSDVENMSNRKDLFCDDKIAVIRFHQVVEHTDETPISTGSDSVFLKRVSTRKYDVYFVVIVCEKGIYSCVSDNFGFGIFKLNDKEGDDILSSVRSVGAQAEEKQDNTKEKQDSTEEKQDNTEEVKENTQEEKENNQEEKKSPDEFKKQESKVPEKKDTHSLMSSLGYF